MYRGYGRSSLWLMLSADDNTVKFLAKSGREPGTGIWGPEPGPEPRDRNLETDGTFTRFHRHALSPDNSHSFSTAPSSPIVTNNLDRGHSPLIMESCAIASRDIRSKGVSERVLGVSGVGCLTSRKHYFELSFPNLPGPAFDFSERTKRGAPR